jgi:hypothetical protein
LSDRPEDMLVYIREWLILNHGEEEGEKVPDKSDLEKLKIEIKEMEAKMT